jgi:predicted extracellular nuclease
MKKRPALLSTIGLTFVLLAILGISLTVQAAPTVSTTVVISQFQVAGGTAADEFIELHNVSGSNVDLNGYNLVYRSASGTSDVPLVNWSTSTIIPPGGYYLVGATPGYDGSPTADITYADSLPDTF